MTVYNYPAPCSPEYKKPTNVEDLIPLARILVRKERGLMHLGPVESGDRTLIVTLPDQDKIVAEAITQALLEAGAKKVDFVNPDELVGKHPEITSVADGWREAEVYRQGKGSGAITEADLVTGLGLGEGLYRYLEEHSEYTSVFADVAGWNMKRALGKHAHKFRGFYSTNTWEEFLLRTQGFPDEVWEELENQIIDAVGKASEVQITDPEGTHIEYKVNAEEARRWQMSVGVVPGHLAMDPLMATASEYSQLVTKAPFILSDLNGVLAGTANHCGFFLE